MKWEIERTDDYKRRLPYEHPCVRIYEESTISLPKLVCEVYGGNMDMRERAAQIVREHNAHTAMVEALEHVVGVFKEVDSEGTPLTIAQARSIYTKAQAALRLAGKE